MGLLFGELVERFALGCLAALFFAEARFLLDVRLFAADAFFVAAFFADGRFFSAVFFLLGFFAVGFFFEAVFFAVRFFEAVVFFFAALVTGFFFEVLRFDEGRADVFATRFLLDGLFEDVFLPLGRLLAAAFFVGMECASNGRIWKTRDYTEVQAERNTLGWSLPSRPVRRG